MQFGYLELPQSILRRITKLQDYLSQEVDNYERVSLEFYENLQEVCERLEDYFFSTGEDAKAKRILYIRRRAPSAMKIGKAKDILSTIVAMAPSTELERPPVERRLERKIRVIEHELARMRSNPALEKKIAKLEKELIKIRVASYPSSEDVEKKQEDMLRKFKSAEKKIFVIMPFAQIFDDVWRGGIERACNAEDFGYLRVDKVSLSSWITKDIKEFIKMAHVVIADITGNNPNVMFELGWALALEKKPIVIRQQDDPNTVPFDVKDIRYISYVNSWSGIERLYHDICKFIKSTSETLNKEPTEEKTRKKKSKK